MKCDYICRGDNGDGEGNQMNTLYDKRIRYSVLALVILQAAHSAEEYFFGFYKFFTSFDYFATVPGLFIAVNALIAVSLTGAYFLIYKPEWQMKIILLFAIVEFWNGLHHILWCAVMGAYFPGAVTGFLLMIPSAYIAKVYFTARDSGKGSMTS